MPLMRKTISARFVWTTPFCSHSSVTWNVLLLHDSKSMSVTFRSLFSLGTKTDFSPRIHSSAVWFPSGVGFRNLSFLIISSMLASSKIFGLSINSCVFNTFEKYMAEASPLNSVASARDVRFHPICSAYWIKGSCTVWFSLIILFNFRVSE